MKYWEGLRHLFENDDGSLPDVFVDNLTTKEQVGIYKFVLSHTKVYDNPAVWLLAEKKDFPVSKLENSAQLYIDGKIDSFRHCLIPFSIDGVMIPQLSIFLSENCVGFDYRMGEEWTEKSAIAFLQLLKAIKLIAPKAKIYQADEGGAENPNMEFSELLESFICDQQ